MNHSWICWLCDKRLLSSTKLGVQKNANKHISGVHNMTAKEFKDAQLAQRIPV